MAKSWSDAKRSEFVSYMAHISAWETERYLKFF
jgi:glutamine synthetase